jgi:hypothetical protein
MYWKLIRTSDNKIMFNTQQMILEIKFRGIDDWNRPIYKVANNKYKSLHFGSTNTLFDYEDSAAKVNDYFIDHMDELKYFGDHFNCEPHGGMPFNGFELKII